MTMNHFARCRKPLDLLGTASLSEWYVPRRPVLLLVQLELVHDYVNIVRVELA